MPTLLQLPPEILYLICEKLTSLDEYMTLTWTCKSVRSAIYENPHTRRSISKSIILATPHHEYDIDICHIEGIKSYANLTTPISYDHNNTIRCGNYYASLSDTPSHWDLGQNDFMVRIIWKRWYQMKGLFKLYLDPEVSKAYRDCPLVLVPSVSPFRDVPRANILDARKTLLEVTKVDSLKEDDELSYRRFYRALTAHWKGSSLYHIAQISNLVYPTTKDTTCYKSAALAILQQRNKALGELVDIVEVVEFVWGFLGYTIFGLPDYGSFPWAIVRFYNLLQNIAFLQPPDFLKLFQDHRAMSDKEKERYVEEAISIAARWPTRGNLHNHQAIEVGIFKALARYPNSAIASYDEDLESVCERRWQDYSTIWAEEVKGRVFQTETFYGGRELYDKIMGNV